MKKFIVGLIIGCVILVSMLIQINLLSVVTLFGTAANVGIVLVVGIGLMCDKVPGSIVGFSYGLLQDILFSKALGVYALLYMLLGYISGKIGKGFSKENKNTLITMVGISTVIFESSFLILAKMMYQYDIVFLSCAFTIAKEIIYNIIIAFILFKPITFLAEIVNKSKNSYYLL